MTDFQGVLRQALATVIDNLEVKPFDEVTDQTNIFDNIDSFTVVDLLLESEMALEAATGNYVTLADETVFDAEKSPLLSWASWVKFVEACHVAA